MPTRPRVIVASPVAGECDMIADWLAADGFLPVKKTTARAAIDDIKLCPFDLLVADFVFACRDDLHGLARLRNPRSPAVILANDDTASQARIERMRALHVARPVERALLMCSVTMAILEGRPQRRSARKTVNGFQAVVNNVPSYLVDVSNEGLRIEVPRGRSVLPPSFVVKVPVVGVAVSVQRMWASTLPGDPRHQVIRCGATLAQDQPRAERAWRRFVDTIPMAGGPGTDSFEIG